MRLFVLVLFVLPLLFAPARATTGFACNAADRSIKAEISGAYGTSLGSGLANFGANIDILLANLPAPLRKFTLDSSHVRQHWFVGRTLNMMTVWSTEDSASEVTLMIETRRGPNEEDAYVGRYTLSIETAPIAPATEASRRETTGKITCGIG